MRHLIQATLREIQDTRKTNNEAIHASKGVEAKDFGRVVGYGGVVEGAIEDEENDVGVAGPGVREETQGADQGSDGDEEGEGEGRGGVV